MGLNSSATFTDKVIATGLPGLASYGLVSTTSTGISSVYEAATPRGKIVRPMFFVLFEFIGAYSVLTMLGYLHKG